MLKEQYSIRKGRSCIYGVFTVQQITGKQQEQNLPPFVDFTKAFHRVIRLKLWGILKNRGITIFNPRTKCNLQTHGNNFRR